MEGLGGKGKHMEESTWKKVEGEKGGDRDGMGWGMGLG